VSERAAIVAVLAGGRGERLGGAKACVELAGAPLIAYPLRAAARAGLGAVVVAKEGSTLPPVRERVIREPAEPRHPLCGLVCALEHAARAPDEPAVVVLACDMPFLSGALVRALAREPEGAAMACLDGLAQPTLCRCEPTHLPALRAALERRLSLRAALRSLEPVMLEESWLERFGEPARLCFNVNTPAELALARASLTGRARPDAPRPPAAARASASSAPRSSS
jgi:molybdenum cofactor guanylyltransferase